MGGGRHVEIGDVRQRGRVEPLNLVGTLGGEDQRCTARAIIGVDVIGIGVPDAVPRGAQAKRPGHPSCSLYTAPFNRSSASAILALRATASSRFSFSSSTTSSGAFAMKFGLFELGIDARDVGVGLLHFLGEPRALGGKIDHALERQRRHLAAHDELHRALRRGRRRGNLGHARQPLDEFGPALGARLASRPTRRPAPAGSAAVMFISARTERMAVTRSITQPISASALSSARPSSCGQRDSASSATLRPLLGRHRPQFLGDERHERMQQLEDLIERPGRHRARLVLGRAVRTGQQRLRQLDIPVAIDVPDEAIGRAGGLVEP